MKRKFIIKPSSGLRVPNPLLFFVVLWLVLDRAGINNVGWAVYYTLSGLIMLVFLIQRFGLTEVHVDIQQFLKDLYKQQHNPIDENIKEKI